ncbi:MAG TPA: ribonuclease P protein component [Candidatus Aquilonibacter sp.]|nr:ribonuclease P protein component [Candidatus Aquilonibacter sp.]
MPQLVSTLETISRLRLQDVIALGVPGIQSNTAMPSSNAGRFPRSARLLRHADFERVYKAGRRHFSASMTVFYLSRPQDPGAGKAVPVPQGLRVGFTVGRALGGAVERNRMKRRLREAVRMSLPANIVLADVVINPKKSLLKIEFSEVLAEIRRAFGVIEKNCRKPDRQ